MAIGLFAFGLPDKVRAMRMRRWIGRAAALFGSSLVICSFARADWLGELPSTASVVEAVRGEVDSWSAHNPRLAKDESELAIRMAATFEMLRWFIESQAVEETSVSPERKAAMLDRLVEYRRAELTIGRGLGRLKGHLREYCDRHLALHHGRFLYATTEDCLRKRFAMDVRTQSWAAAWRSSIFPRLFCDRGAVYNNWLQLFIDRSVANPKADPFRGKSPLLQDRHIRGNVSVCGEHGGDADGDGLCDLWEAPRETSNTKGMSRCVANPPSRADRCADSNLPAARPHGWPRGTNYTASIVETGRQGETRPADDCSEVEKRAVCWTWTKVEFKIFKHNDPRSDNSFWGWKFKSGTFRFDGKLPASCGDFDPRFNCHGLSLAEGRYWLDNGQTKEILSSKWCKVVEDQHRRGDIAVHAELVESPPPEGWNAIAHALHLRKPGKELVFHHSRTVEVNGMEFDEKLGILRYEPLPTWFDISRERWPKIPPKYYRCDF